jgi:hypothetical protein
MCCWEDLQMDTVLAFGGESLSAGRLHVVASAHLQLRCALHQLLGHCQPHTQLLQHRALLAAQSLLCEQPRLPLQPPAQQQQLRARSTMSSTALVQRQCDMPVGSSPEQGFSRPPADV